MKRIVLGFLAACILAASLSGCAQPNSLQMDLSQGYGERIKLLHLNASDREKRELIQEMFSAILSSVPLEKDPAMFAYYPDYTITITGLEPELEGDMTVGSEKPGAVLSAIVDVNDNWVDVQFTENVYLTENGQENVIREPGVIYRSIVTAEEFRKLVNHS